MIRVSELLNNRINPLLHGALMSRIIVSSNNGYFAAVSSYKKSSRIEISDVDFERYNEEYRGSLNHLSGSTLWISLENYRNNYSHCGFNFSGNEKAIYLIENDLYLTRDSLFNQLYAKLFKECEYLRNDELTEEKKNFIRGFCELRGSIDTSRPLIAMDYYYESVFELGKARLLNEYLTVPYYIINLNFRDLQNDFINNNNKRNTQLRLQLNWYVRNIGLISDYKSKIVEEVYHTPEIQVRNNINYIPMPIIESRESDLFIKRLSFFSTRIFGNNLSRADIEILRNELGFDIDTARVDSVMRNRDIVELVRLFTADVCAGCNNEHNLENRTFKHRRTGRLYFEIHHNISFANNLELDHEDNLVKLCPVCHTCMKRGVGTPDDQKRIIENILTSQVNVSEFASHFFNTNNSQDLVNYIYESLR